MIHKEDIIFESNDFTKDQIELGEYELCKFINCNFNLVDLTDFRFSECEFINCDLSIVNLNNCVLNEVIFTNCKMIGVHFYEADQNFSKFEFQSCTLDNSTFQGMDLKDSSIINSSLQDVDYTDANLSNSKIKNCNCLDTKFENTILNKVDFRESYNFNIDPENNQINKAKFSNDSIKGLLIKYNIEIS